MERAQEPSPVRVLVVDDHAGFRAAVRSMLSVDGRMDVCLSVPSAEAAFDALAADEPAVAVPDLVLIDVNMAGMNGMVAAVRLVAQYPGLRVVVSSTAPPANLPPLPEHPDVMFVPKDELDADALWHWATRSAESLS
jgi:CheY-like chemotaxis protein